MVSQKESSLNEVPPTKRPPVTFDDLSNEVQIMVLKNVLNLNPNFWWNQEAFADFDFR